MKKSTLVFSCLIILVSVFITFGSFLNPVKALTDGQIESVLDLLRSFGVDQVTVAEVETALTGSYSNVVSVVEFGADLGVGSTGVDVKRLQRWLNGNGYKVADSGAGSSGNETDYFGERTRSALAGYQLANSIEPPLGYFGSQTRRSINSRLRYVRKEGEVTERPDEDGLKIEEDTFEKEIKEEQKEEGPVVLTQSVEVDRESYEEGDRIEIAVKLKNPTDEEVKLNFRSGCQYNYSIGDFRLKENTFCTQAVTEVLIPAGKYHVWETVHDLSKYPIYPGVYDIRAGTVSGVEVLHSEAELGPEALVKIEIFSEGAFLGANKEGFVNCLKDAGVVIYGSDFCVYCKELIDCFGGKGTVSPIYVDCYEEGDRCADEMHGVGVPEIQIEGDLYQGSREPKHIGEVVGCQL